MNAAARFTLREIVSVVDDYRRGKTLQQIADERCLSLSTIHQMLKDANEPRRSKGATMREPVPAVETLTRPKKIKGLSTATKPKLVVFGTTWNWWLRSVSRVRPLNIVDANSGTGQSPCGWAGTAGQIMRSLCSPKNRIRSVNVLLIEKRPQDAKRLQELYDEMFKRGFNESEMRQISIVCGDNNTELVKFLAKIDPQDPLFISSDPFGYLVGTLDWSVLRQIKNACSDVVMTLFYPQALAKMGSKVKAVRTRMIHEYKTALGWDCLISQPTAGYVMTVWSSARYVPEIRKKWAARAGALLFREDTKIGSALYKHCDTVHGSHGAPDLTSKKIIDKMIAEEVARLLQ